MYSYLKGTLVTVADDACLVEVHGIGYKVHLAANYSLKLPTPPKEVFLHVSFVIREFSQALYGFLHESERDIFEKLLNISGIGPKLALSIVGHLTPSDLKSVLINKDVKTLCNVPGIGKKTAERLLLELKEASLAFVAYNPQVSAKNPPLLQDAISALINLGYNQSQAVTAVTQTLETFSETPDIAELISASLRNV